MKKIKPSKYFCWVVHMDGMEEKHDESVDRKGVFKKAKAAIASASPRATASAPTPPSSAAATWKTCMNSSAP